ncbi:MAG: WD40 repeat domain-containing protein [Bdellovibrionota bacterium]
MNLFIQRLLILFVFLATVSFLARAQEDQPIGMKDDHLKPIMTLKGHDKMVRSVAFSPNGKMIASGSDDQTIRLWDTKTGKLIRMLNVEYCTAESVAFSPDGKVLAAGYNDGTIQLWDIETGKNISTLKDYSGSSVYVVYSIAFSPDGTLLVSGNLLGQVMLWDVQTGKKIKELDKHQGIVNSVAFSLSGNMIASGSNDRTIHLFDTKTRKLIRSLSKYFSMVESVAFSPDSKVLASGSNGGKIQLWDVKTGENIWTLNVDPDSYTTIFSVAFSPDGKVLASGSNGGKIQLWDVKTGKNIKTLNERLGGILSVAFSPDGKTLASGSNDNTIMLWKIEPSSPWESFNEDFSLENLEPSIKEAARFVYPEKSVFLQSIARIVSKLPPLDTSDRVTYQSLLGNLKRLYILNSLKPLFENIESEVVEQKVLPVYQKMHQHYLNSKEIQDFQPIFTSEIRAPLSLEILRAALESQRTFIWTESDRKQFEELMALIGQAVAANAGAESVRAVVAKMDEDGFVKMFEALAGSPRARALALVMMAEKESLRGR